jgi:enhancin-like peptidase M60 family/peptidase M60-like protein
MRINQVVFALFAVTSLAFACHTRPCHADDADLEFLLKGVARIAAPGIPGPLSTFGKDAFPVIAVASDGETREPVVVAARVGRGRVVCLGHTGYLSPQAFESGDTGQFVANALRWVANKPKATVSQLRIGTLHLETTAKWLREHNVPAGELASFDQRALKACDVVCVQASRLRDPQQRKAIRAYVASGGGLLTADLGWGWQQLNPGKNLTNDHPGNQLLADAGIVWCDGYLKKSPDGDFAVDEPPSPLTHAGRALEAIAVLDSRPSSLSDSDVRQAVAVVSRAVRSIPSHDSLLLPKLAALEKKHAGSLVPSKQQPITWKTPLARLLLTLQLVHLRSVPCEEIVAHPAATAFPGTVKASVARVLRTVTIDTSVPQWHSTGLYAAPGEVVRVKVPRDAAGKKLWVRIGAHNDRLWGKDRWNRCPEVCARFPVDAEKTEAANAFGGPVYIEVPRNCSLGPVEVEIEGAVEAPCFVLDETETDLWRSEIRRREAPWAELAGKKIILTVPFSVVRELDDPAELMRFWDRVADACAELAARPIERERPERYVVDVQISAGYMHSGYPIMTHDDVAATMVDLSKLMNQGHGGVWGFCHEIGHNHQSGDWTFSGTGEVTVNLFTLYVLDRVCGTPPHEARDVLGARRKALLKKYRDSGSSFDQWKRDPFLALIMYVQLQEAFGWEAFQKVFAEYRDLPQDERPKTDDDKRNQWLVRFSRTVGHDLGPFFQSWGVPTSADARRSIKDLPEWTPTENQ